MKTRQLICAAVVSANLILAQGQSAKGTAAAPPKAPVSLAGKWKFSFGDAIWTVRLAPRPNLPGQFSGKGERQTPDADGKPVTELIGAALVKGDLRVWVNQDIIVCKGPYRPAAITEGECNMMGGVVVKPFKAERAKE